MTATTTDCNNNNEDSPVICSCLRVLGPGHGLAVPHWCGQAACGPGGLGWSGSPPQAWPKWRGSRVLVFLALRGLCGALGRGVHVAQRPARESDSPVYCESRGCCSVVKAGLKVSLT